MVVVDQLPMDYLTDLRPHFGNNGFERLFSAGAVFANCRYEHATTQTAPGHASVVSGLFPRSHGIIANHWYDRMLKRKTYSAEDTLSPVLTAEAERADSGRSSIRMFTVNLGDELKRLTGGRARVYSISNKDRSAIFMGGKHPDGVYWFREDQDGAFTSTYYKRSLPAWLAKFNETHPAQRYFGKRWVYAVNPNIYTQDTLYYRYADNPFNHDGFPYRITGGDTLKCTREFYEIINESPFASDLLLDFTGELLKHEPIGDDEITDLLCISFSDVDFIGHSFGPSSREYMDAVLRMDRQLAALFEIVESRVPPDEILWVLTSDHGIAPLAELSGGARVGAQSVRKNAELLMTEKYGKSKVTGNYIAYVQYPNLYFDDDVLREKTIDKEEAANYISQSLVQKMQYVERAFPFSRLEQEETAKDSLEESVRKGFVSGRSGDVVMVLKPYSLWSSKKGGAEHGQPYPYDSHVPLLFYGDQWFQSGTYNDRCSPVDIVPTIASILDLNISYRLDGRALKQAVRSSKPSSEE